MRARYEDLRAWKGNDSFRAFRREAAKFEFDWHYHPEYEITLIEKGSGKRLVGDNYENFSTGDLVMIGKDLPHTWASDRLKNGKSSAVVIQFGEEILESFLALSEFRPLKNLLSRARQGLFYSQKNIPEITDLIKNLPDKKGAARFGDLLQILDKLCRQRAVLLASVYFQPVKGEINEKRIARVCQWIHKNSSEKIGIKGAASLVHLSESAFCKFFKRATGKTFSDYVNEIRIGHVCHLLAESDKTIADICYSSGFESVTYFNRVFLRKKGSRPKEFRSACSPERK
jgi:AraC-like DNA-binding protein